MNSCSLVEVISLSAEIVLGKRIAQHITAFLAQLVERGTSNAEVAGSTPSEGKSLSFCFLSRYFSAWLKNAINDISATVGHLQIGSMRLISTRFVRCDRLERVVD